MKVEPFERKILEIARNNLSIATKYGGFKKIDKQVEEFRKDPVWSLFGMNNREFMRLRYIGNYYTSIFRKFGDMYEEFVRVVISHRLGIPRKKLGHSIDVMINGRPQARSIDILVRFDQVPNEASRRHVQSVVTAASQSEDWIGIGFEVRCCYQIGDSKRIQADETMGLALRERKLFPSLMVFCTTSLRSPIVRLKKTWNVTEGKASYDFLADLTGFDLYACLKGMSKLLIKEMKGVMQVFG